MRFEIENIGAVKKKINVEISPETVDSEIDAAYSKLKDRVKVDGFRKGKAPRSILERHYKGHVEYDVTSKLINEAFRIALSENQIIPVSEPEVEGQPLEAGTPFRFTATVEIRPEIDVKGYEGLRLNKESVSVTDEMVDERVEAMRRQSLALDDGSSPYVDDEFAKDMGCDTVSELKAQIRNDLEKERAAEAKGKMKDQIIDALIERNPFEVPQSMLKKQIDYLKEELKIRYGKTVAEIDREIEKGEVVEGLEKAALRQIKGFMILAAIAKKEGMAVSGEDVDERLCSISARSGIDAAVVRSYYEKNKLIESLRRGILDDKVYDKIIGTATVTESL